MSQLADHFRTDEGAIYAFLLAPYWRGGDALFMRVTDVDGTESTFVFTKDDAENLRAVLSKWINWGKVQEQSDEPTE